MRRRCPSIARPSAGYQSEPHNSASAAPVPERTVAVACAFDASTGGSPSSMSAMLCRPGRFATARARFSVEYFGVAYEFHSHAQAWLRSMPFMSRRCLFAIASAGSVLLSRARQI